ncbi:hypothetical protein [Haloarchaeobius sp. DFWS5]|uniref:hypothetical protein n=1 Tax=Haloarchaeobius sp. DFWS5 TaxID=3446114 RepID=UPI003EBF5B41
MRENEVVREFAEIFSAMGVSRVDELFDSIEAPPFDISDHPTASHVPGHTARSFVFTLARKNVLCCDTFRMTDDVRARLSPDHGEQWNGDTVNVV